MEIWGPRLPNGWTYPASRRQLRAAFQDVADIGIRLHYQSPVFSSAHDSAPLPVVAEASMYHYTRESAFTPRITVYGWRAEAYPEAAREEFLRRILPELHGFLLSEVGSRDIGERREVRRVLWRNGAHEVVVAHETAF